MKRVRDEDFGDGEQAAHDAAADHTRSSRRTGPAYPTGSASATRAYQPRPVEPSKQGTKEEPRPTTIKDLIPEV